MKLKTLLKILALVCVLDFLTGCTEAEKVSYNVSQEADNFNVVRRIAVINMRTDKPVFEMVGRFSIHANSNNELEVIVEVAEGQYKKHFIYLNDLTMYVVEDISGANVNKYEYEVNFLPEMIVPYELTMKD